MDKKAGLISFVITIITIVLFILAVWFVLTFFDLNCLLDKFQEFGSCIEVKDINFSIGKTNLSLGVGK